MHTDTSRRLECTSCIFTYDFEWFKAYFNLIWCIYIDTNHSNMYINYHFYYLQMCKNKISPPPACSGGYLSVYMCNSSGQLQTIQQVVSIVVVHLKIMQLKLLGRHVFLRFVDDPLQVLHDVAENRGDQK